MASQPGGSRDAAPQPTVCKAVNLTSLKELTAPAFPDLKYQYGGYLSVGSQAGSALGFIFSGAQSAKTAQELATKPIILWMNGGPGSSSQMGNFYELGRVRLKGLSPDNKYMIEENKNAWDSNYSVLFLDQPLGTGLSDDAVDPADFTSSVAQSTEHLFNAVTEFFGANGCFGAQALNVSVKSTPFFVFGESYAGKYAPALGSKILAMQKNGTLPFSLRGVAIGDGFTDPSAIVLEMPQYASSASLISRQERAEVELSAVRASFQVKAGKTKEAVVSFYQTLEGIVNMSYGVNVYDIRMYEGNTDDSFV